MAFLKVIWKGVRLFNPTVLQIGNNFFFFFFVIQWADVKTSGVECSKIVSSSMLNITGFQWEDLISISSPLIGIPQKLHCSSGKLSQRPVRWEVAFILASVMIALGDLKKLGYF